MTEVATRRPEDPVDRQAEPPAPEEHPTPVDPTPVHRTPVQMRFADTDALGHVNNGSFVLYAEIAGSPSSAPSAAR